MSAATLLEGRSVQHGTRFFRPGTRPAQRSSRPVCRPTYRSLRFLTQVEIRTERWLFFFLAVAAVIAITYGFSCLIDLVQNWAAMERGIANLI